MSSSTEVKNVEVKFLIRDEVPVDKIEYANDFEFRMVQKDGKNYLSEITLVVNNGDEESAISEALSKANLLCDLISFKCKRVVIPTPTNFLTTYKDGHTSTKSQQHFKVWQNKNLELHTNEIKNIEKDPKRTIYHHFSRSFTAFLSYDDHATVIRESHQILEDDPRRPPHLKKYKLLRHALSHGDKLDPATITEIDNNFGPGYFVFKNQRFDYSSSVNMEHLRSEAWGLMNEMLKAYWK